MQFTLLSAIPCSRVDLRPSCKDGRGGWVYSQSDPCRCFTNFKEPCCLFFALSVFAAECESDDSVESTTLTARMGESQIGTNTLEWGHQHWGFNHDDGAVFSWPQRVSIEPETDGLVDVSILVKLRSQQEAIEVDQQAHCHIREEDRDATQRSRFSYLISQLRRQVKTFR